MYQESITILLFAIPFVLFALLMYSIRKRILNLTENQNERAILESPREEIAITPNGRVLVFKNHLPPNKAETVREEVSLENPTLAELEETKMEEFVPLNTKLTFEDLLEFKQMRESMRVTNANIPLFQNPVTTHRVTYDEILELKRIQEEVQKPISVQSKS